MTTPETKEVNIFETHVIPPEDEDDNVSLQPEDLIQKPVEEDKSEALKLRCLRHLKLKNLKSQSPLLMLFLMIKSPGPWSPKMSYCGGITDLGTYLLQELKR